MILEEEIYKLFKPIEEYLNSLPLAEAYKLIKEAYPQTPPTQHENFLLR